MTSKPHPKDGQPAGVGDVGRAFVGEEAEPHYLGHRDRLRERFVLGGADTLPDYELMELVLFAAIPRRDVKPLAKNLIAKFGSFAEIIAAPPRTRAQACRSAASWRGAAPPPR